MNPRSWAAEGVELAQTEVYRGVERFHEPSSEYRQRVLEDSRIAIARAGYRLADLLESALESRK
jgi:hypothetical protein